MRGRVGTRRSPACYRDRVAGKHVLLIESKTFQKCPSIASHGQRMLLPQNKALKSETFAVVGIRRVFESAGADFGQLPTLTLQMPPGPNQLRWFYHLGLVYSGRKKLNCLFPKLATTDWCTKH